MLQRPPTRPRPTHWGGQLYSLAQLQSRSSTCQVVSAPLKPLDWSVPAPQRPRVVPGIPATVWQNPPGWEEPPNTMSASALTTTQCHPCE